MTETERKSFLYETLELKIVMVFLLTACYYIDGAGAKHLPASVSYAEIQYGIREENKCQN